jgi:hypothetical protein
MIHEGIQDVPRRQVQTRHSDGRDQPRLLIDIKTFKSDNGQIVIVADEPIPLLSVLAGIESASVFLDSRDDLKSRRICFRLNQSLKGRFLGLNEDIIRPGAGELSTVVNGCPLVRWRHQESHGIIMNINEF